MPEFFYKAVTVGGKAVEGSLQRDTEKVVARELRDMGLVPTYIGTGQRKAALRSATGGPPR